MSRLVRAEWLKLTTTRLLWGMIPAAVLLSLAAVTGAVLSADGAGVDLATDEGVRRALHVSATGAILVLIVGIIMSAGEYRTATATDTYLTTPRRWKVLTSKLVVGAGLGAAFGFGAATLAYLAAAVLYRTQDAAYPTTSSEVWAILAGAVVYATVYGIAGVAIGSLLRNQVAAIVVSLAWLLVVEQILVSIAPRIGRWLPGAAGQAIVRTPDRDLLPPIGGAALLCAYVAVIAIAALATARHRDA